MKKEKIVKLRSGSDDEVAAMMKKAFSKDPYFASHDFGGRELYEAMKTDLRECRLHGDAIVAIGPEGTTDGVLIGFTWHELKKKRPESFSKIFSDEEYSKDVERIERAMKAAPRKHRKRFVYIVDMAVRKDRRGRGICTSLVKEIERRHRGRPIVADCSNPLSCRIFEKEGWKRVMKRGCLVFMAKVPKAQRHSA